MDTTDRKQLSILRWSLVGAAALALLFFSVATNATHASPGRPAGQTHISGNMAAGNLAIGNALVGANRVNSPHGFVADAFAYWVYSGTTPSAITVPVGTKLPMDLFINA